jgi:citrate lyase subunit beta / citryl-CoA lyase
VTLPVVYLFVPANRPDRIAKALSSEADVVIVDLEDGVADIEKSRAREGLSSGLDVPPGKAFLRINGRSTPHYERDLELLAGLGWVSSVVIPKVESGDDIAALTARLPSGVAVAALIETARGLTAVEQIAASGVSRLMFGSADYLAEIGAAPGREVLAYPRSRLVVASRAAGLPAPVDGPTLATVDVDAVSRDSLDARALGLSAKLCIHPAQMSAVRSAFGATASEVDWARAVLSAATAEAGGVFAFEGTMVDEPVLARARYIVAHADRASAGAAGSVDPMPTR